MRDSLRRKWEGFGGLRVRGPQPRRVPTKCCRAHELRRHGRATETVPSSVKLALVPLVCEEGNEGASAVSCKSEAARHADASG